MGKYKLNEEMTKNGKYKRKKLLKSEKSILENTCNFSDASQSSNDLNIIQNHPTLIHSDISYVTDTPNNPQNTLEQNLVNWSVSNKIPRVAVTELLKILSKNGIKGLPLDSRTLLNTPRIITIEDLNPGKYIHLGLEKNLNNILNSYDALPDTLLLDLNIDGAPIFDDSYEHGSLWPILCHIYNLKKSPVFAIGIYVGASKPSDFNQLLEPFISEFLNIYDSIVFKGTKLLLKIHNIILDAPARSSVCGIKGHNGYSACPKCTDVGVRKPNGKPALINTDAPLRNNLEFRNQKDKEHHNYKSIFENILDLDMINSFPIDYLHNVLLGVMRKLLELWFGPKGLYPPSVKCRISKKIQELSSHEPREFNRRLRGLEKMGRWKGTELRTFLLYIGPLVLKNEISIQNYENFLLLSVAINILVDKESCIEYNEIAKILLVQFVETYENIYGIENFTYNTHLLIHLSDDCLRNGPLDNFASFKFESYLGKIKSFVRSPNKPIEQIHNRVCELFSTSCQEIIISHSNLNIVLKQPIKYSSFEKALINDVAIICNSEDDAFVQLNNKKVVKVKEFSVIDSLLFANVLLFNNESNIYEIPIKSKELNFFNVNLNNYTEKVVKVSSFKRKMFALPGDSNQILLCPMMPFIN